MLAACSFRHGLPGQAMDAASDGAPDVVPDVVPDAAPRFCPADPHLRLCLSFDQDPLPAVLPNEGAANVSAQLTNVTGGGGAAQLGTTSTIYLPYTAEVTNIQAIEVWYRADVDPANTQRMGLVDSNVSPPNISLFFYRVDPTHQLRCGIGSQTTVWDATLAPGTSYHLACLCDGAGLKMYVDGVLIGDTAGPCASGGAFVADGLTIGSNNNGGPTGVNDWLVGAIDGVRLWDVSTTP